MLNNDKKICRRTVRLPDHTDAAISKAAAAEGVDVAEYIRRACVDRLALRKPQANVERPAPAAALPRFHVDMLGADPLRLDNGATVR